MEPVFGYSSGSLRVTSLSEQTHSIRPLCQERGRCGGKRHKHCFNLTATDDDRQGGGGANLGAKLNRTDDDRQGGGGNGQIRRTSFISKFFLCTKAGLVLPSRTCTCTLVLSWRYPIINHFFTYINSSC